MAVVVHDDPSRRYEIQSKAVACVTLALFIARGQNYKYEKWWQTQTTLPADSQFVCTDISDMELVHASNKRYQLIILVSKYVYRTYLYLTYSEQKMTQPISVTSR
jgi:hypothetical protein